MDTIDTRALIFPINFQHFISTIASTARPQEIKDFMQSILQLRDQLNDTKSTLNAWNPDGLTPEETKSLLNIFTQFKSQLDAMTMEFADIKEEIDTTNEIVEQTKSDVILEVQDEFKTSFDYQREESSNIEKEFHQKRVRDVHYRNKKPKILKTEKSGVIKCIGYCVDKDFPLLVIKIPK